MEINAEKNPSISIITITSLMRLLMCVCVCVCGSSGSGIKCSVKEIAYRAHFSSVVDVQMKKNSCFAVQNNNPINLNAPLIKFKACVRRSRCLKFSVFISRTKHSHSFAGAFLASFCRLYEARDRCLSRSFALFFAHTCLSL